MTDPHYWIIEYRIEFRSDFHVGAGHTLFGGNLHGVRLGDDGFPCLPGTQVRGLLRLGGSRLKDWGAASENLFKRNFAEGDRKDKGPQWSYTPARFTRGQIEGYEGAEATGMLSEQSHVHLDDGSVKNLFSYQKAGALDGTWFWRGRIFSTEPADEKDVAFLVACMRAEDRIGHRRSRGYGKVDWKPCGVWRYPAGETPVPVEMNGDKAVLGDWLRLLGNGGTET